jgi:hypothetical protein
MLEIVPIQSLFSHKLAKIIFIIIQCKFFHEFDLKHKMYLKLYPYLKELH